MKHFIIYHKEDNDGVFSGAMMYHYVTRKLGFDSSDIELFGATYNDLNKITQENLEYLKETFDRIVMVDISFNDIKKMKWLYDNFGSNFIWCDHHKPIILESFKKRFSDAIGVRQTNCSAILCVYKYLYDPFDEQRNNGTIPKLLRLLSGWDSWTYEQEGFTRDYCQFVNKGVTNEFKLDIMAVVNFLDTYFLDMNSEYEDQTIQDWYDTGELLVNYDNENAKQNIINNGDNKWVVKNGDEIRPACAIFIQGGSNSIMFSSLKNTEIKNGIVFKRNSDSTWTISLYNVNDNDEFHCGEFLKKKYKGGGHLGAAGCTVKQSKFIRMLKTKEI